MKITKKELIKLIKEELKNIDQNFNNENDTSKIYKIDNFKEVIRLVENLRIIENDIVALELLEIIKEDLNNEKIPDDDLLKKFESRLNSRISELITKINLIDREFKSFIS